MAVTFANESFTDAGTDPMNPSSWVVSITVTSQEIAEYGAAVLVPPEAFEGFENLWADLTAQATVRSNAAETYALVNGETLTVKVDGGAAQTATFNTGDFVSIAAATAAEVATVITTDITGATASADTSNTPSIIKIQSDTVGDGSSIEVTGGSAFIRFLFPSEEISIDDNRSYIDALTFGVLGDTKVVTYHANGPLPQDFEPFEREWGGYFPGIESSVRETYTIGASTTLLVKVDGGSVQTVTFVGTETTAVSVAAAISAQVTGATASDRDGYVRVEADTSTPESSIQVTGGTANSVLLFSTAAVIVDGNEDFDFGTVDAPFGSGGVAFYDTSLEEFEDFEDEWPDNDTTWLWKFGDQSFLFETFVSGKYEIRLTSTHDGGVTETYDTTGTTVGTVVSALGAAINLSSAIASATDASPSLVIIPDDARIKVDMSIVSVPSGASVLLVQENIPSDPPLKVAPYDSGTPENFEDFEEEWNNDDYDSALIYPSVYILTAETGTYTVTTEGETAVTYVATVPTDTVTDIASSLSTSLAAKASISVAFVVTHTGPPLVATIELVPVDRTQVLSLTATHSVTPGNVDVGSARESPTRAGRALYSPSAAKFENFETLGEEQGVNPEWTVEWTSGTPPAGDYFLTVGGVAFKFTSTGVETGAAIAADFETQIDSSGVPAKAEGGGVLGGRLYVQSDPPLGARSTLSVIGQTANSGEMVVLRAREDPVLAPVWVGDGELTSI